MDQPTSLDGLICRTEKYSTLEEDKVQRGRRPDERPSSSSIGKRKRDGDHQKDKHSETSHKGFNTVFTEHIYKVMSKIKDKQFFKWPKAIPSDPSRRDPDKYCSYYKDHGHMTKKCKLLKFFLEYLVKKSHIQGFVNMQATRKGIRSSQTSQLTWELLGS